MLRVDLVRAAEVDRDELAEDLVPLVRRSPGRACSEPRPSRARSRRAPARPASARGAGSPRNSTSHTSTASSATRRERRGAYPCPNLHETKEPRCLSASPTCPTPTTRSSRRSTRARWRSTTASTIRPTSTTPTRRSRGRSGRTRASSRCSRRSTAMPDDIRTAVRNNAGGHANHSLFWQIMSPDGGGEPEGELKAAIDDLWDSTDELKNVINDDGVKRFGSGWTWLVYDGTEPRGQVDAEPGQPADRQRRAAPRHRRLGARLLPQLPEPASGLPRGVVERGRLGRGRRGASTRADKRPR